MKKSGLFLLFLFLGASYSKAQSISAFRSNPVYYVYGGTGVANYYGDIKENFGDIQAQPNLVLGLKRRLHLNATIGVELTWFRISGKDSKLDPETGKPIRNLSFRSDNFELLFVGTANLFPTGTRFYKDKLANPYALFGVGVTYFNPKAKLNGDWHALQPLETEGVKYSRFTPVINLGLGVNFNVSEELKIGVDGAYRFTFTDYLDDASGPGYRDLATFTDPVAEALSDRREPPFRGGGLNSPGGVRGNPDNNDGYFLLNVKVQYKLPRYFLQGLFDGRKRGYYRR